MNMNASAVAVGCGALVFVPTSKFGLDSKEVGIN
jgi:hypothetical protein